MKWKTAPRRIFLLFVMLVTLSSGIAFGAPVLAGAKTQVSPDGIKKLESFVAQTEESLQALEQSYQDLRLILAHSEPPWPQSLEMFDTRMHATTRRVVATTQAVRALLNAEEQITPARMEAAFQDLFAADMVLLAHYLSLVQTIDKLTEENEAEQHTP